MSKKLTSNKAKQILKDKEVHGHPLTEQQRKFFGAIAGGAEPYKAQVGNTITPITPQASSSFFDLIFSAPQKLSTMAFTGRYETPSEAMNIENPYGAFALNAILDPINLLAGAGILKSARKALAFKPNPEAFYRGLGKSGLEDALESKLLRTANKTGTYGGDLYMTPNFSVAKTAYSVDKPTMIFNPKKVSSKNPWGMESVKPKDAKSYIVEIPKSKVPGAEQVGEGIFKTKGPISIDDVKFYTEDWLRGYKQVKPPKKQNGGWLDKYDAPQAQNGIEGTMGGLTDVGFNYNGAWGGTMQDGGMLQPPMAGANQTVPMAQLGDSVKPIPMQLAMGGSLPGAVGFTYARTVGAAPSNGPYAKKTKASAQNGQEMKYYQEGLDFKPKTISQDGSEIPVDPEGYWNPENWGNPVIIPSNIITMEGVDQPLLGISDTGDVQYMEPGEDYEFDGEYVTEYPVAQAGIRTLPNVTVKDKKKPIIVPNPNDPRLKAYQDSLYLYNEANRISDLLRSKGYDINKADWVSKEGNFYATRYRKDKSDMPDMLKMYEAAARLKFPKPISTNLAVRSTNNDQGVRFYDIDLYAKPKQKVEYIKPEPKPEPEVEYKPRPRVEAELPRTSIGDLSYNLPKASAQPSKTKKITTQKDEPERTKKTPVKDFLEDMRLRMEDRKMERKTKRGIKSQLKCFSGVCYDDEGNIVQAKDGVSVNNADAQPVKKLDQLLNFTNYNKPTKGGWLDKYN
jgi:hypothetical protein